MGGREMRRTLMTTEVDPPIGLIVYDLERVAQPGHSRVGQRDNLHSSPLVLRGFRFFALGLRHILSLQRRKLMHVSIREEIRQLS